MEMLVIDGGALLRGAVAVSGAKNAALPILAASLMGDAPLILRNVPRLVDVATMIALLETLGVETDDKGDSLTLSAYNSSPFHADYELVRRMRAGVSVLGPLLAKRGRAVVSLPGGCNIGTRPIELHLKGLRALGAEIRIERGYVIAKAGRLRGAKIDLAGPRGSTVTGTCNVMSAATLSRGTTIIENAAREPEVVDLGECLNAMGASIAGLGTPRLEIIGVDSLGGTAHTVIPDRIEAATLMIAAAITKGTVEIENVRLDHLDSVIEALKAIGASLKLESSLQAVHCASNNRNPLNGAPDESLRRLTVTVSARPRSVNLTAEPYPGLPTDVQAQFMALLATADGPGTITDRVFPDRFMHAAELNRMGANVRRIGNSALVTGVERLSGACVMASDLRASAALVLAALAANGPTVVRRIYHLDRGYESLESKLNALGARIHRVEDAAENLPPVFRNEPPPLAA